MRISDAPDAVRERVRQSLSLFDNHDPRLPYRELALDRALDGLPGFVLPEGFRFETYAPGDRDAWIDIEQSAREFDSRSEGEAAWERYYGGQEDALTGRMYFIARDSGEKVATATAWHDIRTADDGVNAMLHWVAVRREAQGLGLSKPMIIRVLRRMRDLGYRRVAVPTQTTTWLACKVYLDLGFLPIPRSAERSRDGWEIVRTLTDHPALANFARTDVTRWLNGGEPSA